MKKILAIALLVLIPIPVCARNHAKYHVNPVLKGSYEVAIKQNDEIDRLRLPRIVDKNQLYDLIKSGELVFVSSPYVYFQPQVNPYSRPWTNMFIGDLGEGFYTKFRNSLPISSIVRTAEQQEELRKYNRYAAPSSGKRTSSHLAGVTFDIPKRKLTRSQRQWMVSHLRMYRDMGLIEAIEEPQCYHVCVNEIYLMYTTG